MSPQLSPRKKTLLKNSPQAWKDAEISLLRKIRGVCLDIDDTLSTAGKLTGEAYEALWLLKRSGFKVVPISGRPAGWCDHIARFWPVDAVVGENGAFTFFMEGGIRRRLNTPAGKNEKKNKSRLANLADKIRKKFPQVRWASDQLYREYDLAIDICEDVDPWPLQKVQSLLKLCADAGAHAKLSSVHVNAWFGHYDKQKGFDYWLSQGAPGCEDASQLKKSEWIYIGDSPNDEPMFASFKYSVGVSNLRKYLDQLNHCPTWITRGESGEGFAQMARKLVMASGSGS